MLRTNDHVVAGIAATRSAKALRESRAIVLLTVVVMCSTTHNVMYVLCCCRCWCGPVGMMMLAEDVSPREKMMRLHQVSCEGRLSVWPNRANGE